MLLHRNVLRDPNNSSKKGNLRDSRDTFIAALENLDSANSPTGKDIIENLKKKVHDLSPDASDDIFDDIDDLMNQIKNNAVYAANVKDDSERDDILDARNY